MALIFDLDGTLVDSLPGIATAINRALLSLGMPTHSEEAVRSFIGNGALELARRAMPAESDEQVAADLHAAFQREYADTWREGTALFAGIRELIQALATAGRPMAVLSNKPDAFTREIVRHFFSEREIPVAMGQSARFPKKPAPDAALHILRLWGTPPADAVFIGDSSVDRETAHAAGIPFLGVPWGYEDLSAQGCPLAKNAGALATLLG